MEFDKTLTPEQHWDKVKKLIFKGETPKDIEEIMRKGFTEADCESEKWIKLGVFIIMIKQRFVNK
jgi:hypothetical protein